MKNTKKHLKPDPEANGFVPQPNIKIIIPTGTLYKNIHRQFKYSVSAPPNIGPKAIEETPIVAATDSIIGISLGLNII